ncbi:MAG: hypothetical protein AB8F26_05200 [Phycisphaerales bacterium]
MSRRSIAWVVSGWSIPVWLIAVMIAWNASVAASNPREGWSLVRIWIGITGPSPSGDRAYLIRDKRFGLYRTADGGVSVVPTIEDQAWFAIGEPIIRRTRLGLFVPWNERVDLRVLDYTQQFTNWKTGSTDPDWVPVLRALESRPDARKDERESHLTDAIATELAGDHPERRVIVRGLILDIGIVLAHVLLSIASVRCLTRVLVAKQQLDRRRAGRCVGCGYERAGLDGSCPECGRSEP